MCRNWTENPSSISWSVRRRPLGCRIPYMLEVPEQQHVTQLLLAWSGGDKAALDRLMPLIYRELRRVAARHLRREREGHTLQTTALVHEVYLRLVDQKQVQT